MFPKNSLLLGSSLLWSILPLSAKPAAHSGVESKAEHDMLLDARRAAEASRQEEQLRVFDGLVRMFEAGDRRVIPCQEIMNPYLWKDNEKAHVFRVRVVVQLHLDLYDEALSLA